jgi:hypothetical protein
MTTLRRREHRNPLSKLLPQASPVLIDYYALRCRSAATSRSRGSKTDVLSVFQPLNSHARIDGTPAESTTG